MGSSSSKLIDVTDVDLTEWKEVGIHRQTSKIVQSTNGKGIAELQSITFDPKRDLQKEIAIYQYRKNSNNALVKSLGVVQQKVKSPSLCGSSHILKVLIQRIPQRLNQLPQLSFSQTLYSLSESLRGYKDCYHKLGPFDVTDEMIGVNQQGEVKVWVNQNFAENHPEIEKPFLQTSGSQLYQQGVTELLAKKSDQTEMVSKIFQIIQKKNQSGRFPQQFAQRVYSNGLTFDEAFKEIEIFSKSRNIFVPDRLQNFSNKINNGLIDLQATIDRTSVNTALNPARQLFVDQRTSKMQNEQVFSPIIENHTSYSLNQPQKVNSPIQTLFQPQNINEGYQSPRKQPVILHQFPFLQGVKQLEVKQLSDFCLQITQLSHFKTQTVNFSTDIDFIKKRKFSLFM